MAKELLARNAWQKISPLPGFTVPDSITVTRAEGSPKEEDVEWPTIHWTKQQLSEIVFMEYPELRNVPEALVEKNGKTFLKGVTKNLTPTAALKIGAVLSTQALHPDPITYLFAKSKLIDSNSENDEGQDEDGEGKGEDGVGIQD